ncbi:MAG: tRNA (adenosine(37)-N6)-dimethylallyltransferase MiaA [Verrucomicrobia bacterium]|nr:tRNA (adenosine(37)-N6)-dimethylallyltransferase MiaA [Verrucomicrobiota bacterium]
MSVTLHIITGATAVGKTNYALEYCEALNGEIISCDASLFYRGMDIGTAKPSKEELAKVPHHCIDMNPVNQSFDITQFDILARKTVEDILSRGKSVVITGGSGFYLKSFFEPVVDTIEVSDAIRAESESLFVEQGLSGLLERLKAINPEGLGNLDTLNPRRVQRALERCLASGKSLPVLQKEFSERPKPYAPFKKHFILLERDAEALKDRIARRAKCMLESGLLDEVKGLLKNGIEENPNAANAIGYRESIAFLKGEIEESELLPLIIKNTNGLVKKQKTWFRSQLPEPNERLYLSS